MINSNKLYTNKDKIATWALLFCCGNPFFECYLGNYTYVFLIGLIILLYFPKLSLIDYKYLKVFIALLVIVFIGQKIVLGEIGYLASLNFTFKFVCGFLLATIIGQGFKYIYLHIMSIISIICLICFIMQLAGVEFPNLVSDDFRHSIGIYSLYTETPRNCGMFWEPGAFAGYILIAIVLFINNIKELFKYYKFEFLVMSLALFSTFSTTGYIVYAAIMALYLLGSSKINLPVKVLFIIVLAGLSIYLFNHLDFLGEKIITQVDQLEDISYDSNEHGRFGAMIIDSYYIKLHPLVGNGFILSTRYSYHVALYNIDNLQGFGNGFTGIIGSLGIPFMLLYILMFFKNKTLTRQGQVFLVIIVILLLQGEQYMNYALFLMLPFVNYTSLKLSQK